MARAHPHDYSLLYWHFGPYGRQDIHLHSCFRRSCSTVLVGPGRECQGEHTLHDRDVLTVRDNKQKRYSWDAPRVAHTEGEWPSRKKAT